MSAPNRKQRSNMRDVAKEAGVSVATVSRVLNGTQPVAEKTRKQVEQAIEALSFVRSPAARAINSGRTHMVGALVPTLDHAIFSRFLDAIELTLAQSGFSLVVATTGSDPQKEESRANDLLDLGVEGLIVSGVTHSAGFDDLIARRNLPVIFASYFDATTTLPTIGYDNAQVARLALSHLAERGHRQIAVISGQSDNNDRTRARLDGLQSARMEGLTFHECDLEVAAAGDVAERVLRDHPETKAFLCLSDVLAQGVLFRCQRLKVAVPEQVSIIGIDDLPSSASTAPPLTSVHLPVGEMGEKTARAIAHWIETGVAATHEELPARVTLRASTRALAPRETE